MSKSRWLIGTATALSALAVLSTAWSHEWIERSREDWRTLDYRRHHLHHEAYHREQRSYFHRRGYHRLDIPPGAYPAPGECRLWYPGRPAARQPPPGPCTRIGRDVPRGAWLLRHPRYDPDHVHVVVYAPQRPGVIEVIGEFEIASGIFVRVVLSH